MDTTNPAATSRTVETRTAAGELIQRRTYSTATFAAAEVERINALVASRRGYAFPLYLVASLVSL